MGNVFDADQALARLEHIRKLIDDLSKAQDDLIERQDLAERLQRELAIARQALEPFTKNKLPL